MQKRFLYPLAAALLAALGVAAVFLFSGIFPFGSKTVLTGDLAGMYLPFYSFTGESLRGGFAFHSFEKGLGGGVAGLLAYIPVSVYMLPLSFLPKTALADFFSVLLFCKLVLAAGAFCFYLCRKYAPAPLFVALSLGYALMSYSFVYQQNTMWLDNLVMLPLLLLALDRLIDRKKIVPFACAMFLAILANYYTAFMLALFSLVYFFWQACSERRLSLKETLLRFPLFAASGALAAGCSAVLLIPMAVETLQNKGLSQPAGADLFAFAPLDFFRRFFPFGFLWREIESGPPLVFCGVLSLLAVLFYFFCGKHSRTEKLWSGGALAILFLGMFLSPLNRVWHMLRDPVWFPFRQSFLFAAFLLILAAKGVASAARTPLQSGLSGRRAFLSWAGGAAVLCALILLSGFAAASRRQILFAAALMAGTAALFSVWILPFRGGRIRRGAAVLLVAATFAELAANGAHIVRQFELRDRGETGEYLETVGSLLDQTDPDGFHRLEKDSFFSLNDPMLFGYNGLNHFSSVSDAGSESVLAALGYSGAYRNPNFSSAAANALLSVRYILASGPHAGQDVYLPLSESGGQVLYFNPYQLPFAFLAKGTGDASGAETDGNPFLYLNEIYSALCGTDAPLFSETGFSGEEGEYSVANPAPGMYYLYITAKTDGSELTVNGVPRGALGFYSVPGIAPLGRAEPGEPLTFSVNGDRIRVFRLDLGAFSLAVESIRQNAVDALRVEGGNIRFTSGAGTVFLSMPYHPNWRLTVNGEEAALQAAFGHFSAVGVAEEGSLIELRYRPAGLLPGAAVTAVSLAVLALLFASGRRKSRTGQNKGIKTRYRKRKGE